MGLTPGTCSLNHKKIDERIAYRTLTGEYVGKKLVSFSDKNCKPDCKCS